MMTMLQLHKHTNGTFFLLTETGYYTLVRQSQNPGAKFTISEQMYWKDMDGPIPVDNCIAMKPTSRPGIYVLMQSNMVIPISFENDKIV